MVLRTEGVSRSGLQFCSFDQHDAANHTYTNKHDGQSHYIVFRRRFNSSPESCQRSTATTRDSSLDVFLVILARIIFAQANTSLYLTIY